MLSRMKQQNQVLSREQLYSAVWKETTAYNVDEQVKEHIKAIRRKLMPVGKEDIKNEWGVGPLATNGGWIGHTLKDFNKDCRGADVKQGMNIVFDENNLRTAEADIKKWMKGIR